MCLTCGTAPLVWFLGSSFEAISKHIDLLSIICKANPLAHLILASILVPRSSFVHNWVGIQNWPVARMSSRSSCSVFLWLDPFFSSHLMAILRLRWA